ncbi:MAG: hypothetical protein AB2A00_20690 [Myxococcota bacterium]
MTRIGGKITPQNLEKSLDRLDKALEKAVDDKGQVSVDELERRLDVTAEVKGKDVGTTKALEAVKDEFSRTESYWVSSGCSGYSATRTVEPELLKKGEVKNVREALMEAKKRVAGFDTHKADGTKGKDGVISEKEEKAALAKPADDLAGTLAQEALKGARQQIEDAKPRPAPSYSRSSGGCG